MDTSTQTITLLVIVFALVTLAFAAATVIRVRTSARRRGIAQAIVFPVRSNPAFDLLPIINGQAIEADRPVLLSTGTSSLGDESTIVTLAGIEMMYHTIRSGAIGETAPVFVTSDPTTVPLAYSTLARAYHSRDIPVRSGFNNVRWYPSSERSLVFAAMLIATIHSDEATGAVLVGRFGAELGLILAAAQRNNLPTIAGSDDIVGQAVAYTMADGALIGADMFSASGYMGTRIVDNAGLVAQDVLRSAVIFVILVVAIGQFSGNLLGQILAFFSNLFGG